MAAAETRFERRTAFACNFLFIDFTLGRKRPSLDVRSAHVFTSTRALSQVVDLDCSAWNVVGGEGSHTHTRKCSPFIHPLWVGGTESLQL